MVGTITAGVMLLAPAGALADGELDLTFSGDGYGIASAVGIPGLADDMRVADMAVAPGSGKVVMVGQKPPPNANVAIAVLNSDGNPDLGFSTDGFVTGDFGDDAGASDTAEAVVVQSDGKIVVAGTVDSIGVDQNDIWVARFNTDGSLDDITFSPGGAPGEAQLNIGNGQDRAREMVLLPDGDLLIAGSTSTAGGDPVVVRFDGDDGSLTNAFGGDGFAATDFGAADEYLRDLAVQPDGDVVGVGGQGPAGSEAAARVFRFDGTSGLADNDFDGDGSVTLPLPATTPVPADTRRQLTSVAIQPDGEIVVAGVNGDDLSPLTDSSLVLARFDAAGVQDGFFGPGGLVTQKLPLTGFQLPTGAEDLVLQNDGRILLAARNSTDAYVLRYAANGLLEQSFASLGALKLAPPNHNDDSIAALSFTPDGKLLAGGDTFRNDFTGSDPYAARIIAQTPAPALPGESPTTIATPNITPVAAKKKCKKGRKLRKGKCVKKKRKKK